jgi:hypothetical protein
VSLASESNYETVRRVMPYLTAATECLRVVNDELGLLIEPDDGDAELAGFLLQVRSELHDLNRQVQRAHTRAERAAIVYVHKTGRVPRDADTDWYVEREPFGPYRLLTKPASQ